MSANRRHRDASRHEGAPPRFSGPHAYPPAPGPAFPLTLAAPTATALLRARDTEIGEVQASPDLGLSLIKVSLAADGATFPGHMTVSWPQLERIASAPQQCFTIVGEEARPIVRFSEATNLARTLMPTEGAPTTLVSGFSMHRIKGTDPWADSVAKVNALGSVTGRVLDTTTGLGYTAILAARTADAVLTIELDPAALEIAQLNPWSHELFDSPRIERIIGDAFEVVADLPAASFDRVIHDPPYLPLAGDLYSEEMYRRLYRLLRRGGKLFHYIADPNSSSGARTTAGVLRRLGDAGFRNLTRRPEAFGVVAVK